MSTMLGALLRQLRCARQMSMESAAQQAGITRGTIQRWETGECQPRLPEMEAVLRILEATTQQRWQALSLLHAPRAVERLRNEIAQATAPACVTAAGAGGLLRALRLRKRLTLEVTAQRVGVHKSTLTHWERGEAWPPTEKLHALCIVLEAHAEELAALTSGRGAFRPEASETPETLRAEITRIMMMPPNDPVEALKDLLFLRLEASIWSRISLPEYAALLPEVQAAYANFLAGRERYAEALLWANRALERVRPDPASTWWMYAALAEARSEVFRGKRPVPGRGVEILSAWLPELQRPEFAAWALRDMAQYALLRGDVDWALRLSAQSCEVAAASGLSDEVFVRQSDRVVLLLSAGFAQQALDVVPTHSDMYPYRQVGVALLRAEALVALGEAHSAHDWLQCAYASMKMDYLSPFVRARLQRRADKLAQRF